jgi:hypothetical protein
MSFPRSLQRISLANLWQSPSYRVALRWRSDTKRNATTATTIPNNLVKGARSNWQVVIGLEIHAQLCSQHKLFSRKYAEP